MLFGFVFIAEAGRDIRMVTVIRFVTPGIVDVRERGIEGRIHILSELKGKSTLSNDEMVREAKIYVNALARKLEEMNETEAGFIKKLRDRFAAAGDFQSYITVKELFWLRDLNTSY